MHPNKLRVCQTFQRVTLVGALDGKIRHAMYRDVEHLVVPLVAMVEGVVWPVNAPFPEFVSAKTLAAHPEGWNGRPVVNDHPYRSGDYVSANNPEVLVEEKFGEIFNARFAKKALRMEAWFNPILADAIGERAVEILDRARKHDDIEVSGGWFLTLVEREGTFNGKKFQGEWTELVPDHMAFLSKGAKGACSIEMGCGAPRTARMHVFSANHETIDIQEQPMAAEATETPAEQPKSWVSKFLSSFREDKTGRPIVMAGAGSFDMSGTDSQLRSDLATELRAKVPGFMGVEGVNSKEGVVLFSSMPRNEWEFFTHAFTNRGGKVKLSGEPAKVEPVTRFEPVAASTSQPVAAASGGCGCGENKETSMDRSARVAAIIANPKSGFTTAHQAVLASMTDEQLTAAEAVVVEVPAVAAPSQSAAPTAAPAVAAQVPPQTAGTVAGMVAAAAQPETEEQTLARFPRIRDIVNNHESVQAARRGVLVTKLNNKDVQVAFSEQELKDMPLAQLEKFAAAMKVDTPTVATGTVDRSLLVPSGSNVENDEEIPPVASMVASLANPKAAETK